MLSAGDKRRFVRQVLLTEIGSEGQARLQRAAFALSVDADARAAEVAADYLQRAGVRVAPDGEASLALPSTPTVSALAGRAELHEAAAALCGALAAVEAIKRTLSVGAPCPLSPSLTLCQEPSP